MQTTEIRQSLRKLHNANYRDTPIPKEFNSLDRIARSIQASTKALHVIELSKKPQKRHREMLLIVALREIEYLKLRLVFKVYRKDRKLMIQ